MSRTTRVLSGVGVGYAGQIVVTVVGLVLTPFLIRTLGTHDYGLWLVALQLVTYLGLLDLGIVALLPREVAYASGRAATSGRPPELQALVGQTIRVIALQLPFVVLGAIALWWLLPDGWLPLRGPIAAVLLVFVVAFPLRLFQAVLQGLQDLAFTGTTYPAAWLVGTSVTVLLLLRTELHLYAVAIGWAVTQLLSAVACGLRVRHRYPEAFPRSLANLSREDARGKIISGLWVSTTQVAQILLHATDVLVLAAVLGPAAVVPYSLTKKLLDVLANQPQMIMQTAMPGLSELRGLGNREQLSQITVALTQAMLLASGVVAMIVVLVNRGFVTWWVGPGQFSGYGVTGALVLSMLLRHWNTTASYATFCFGHERRISIITLADGVVTLLASVLLARTFGPLGIIAGSILGVMLVSLPSNLRALSRETGTSVFTIAAALLPWFWRFGLLLIVSGTVASRWTPASFVSLAAATSIAAVVYFGVMAPVYLRGPLGVYVRPRLSALGGRDAKAGSAAVGPIAVQRDEAI